MNETAGTTFVRGDVESMWETEWEEKLGLPFTDELWDELKDSYEWRHMGDYLTEHGFQIISNMLAQFVGEKGLRKC